MSSGMKDSDEMWREECHTLIGSMRYFEDPPSYRCATPKSACLFCTRACAYNHHPAIHSLFPNAELMKQRSVEDNWKFRLTNTLSRPGIIQWVAHFMAELDVTVAAPKLYRSIIHWMRSEWGPNCNPHWHRLLWSEYFSALFNDWKSEFSCDFDNMVDNRLLTDNTAFENEQTKQQTKYDVQEMWQCYRNRYSKEIKQ